MATIPSLRVLTGQGMFLLKMHSSSLKLIRRPQCHRQIGDLHQPSAAVPPLQPIARHLNRLTLPEMLHVKL